MAVKHVLKYKYKPPTNLKWLKPESTDIVLTFSVNAKDLNPLFLKELSDEVEDGYLAVLNSAWNDMWAKEDKKLGKVIPDFAEKTEGARKKLLAVYVGPMETEYNKQIKNISSMAQTIGVRYWTAMAKERTEIRNFKLKVGAKVVWKGLGVTSSVVTIVGSGGAAAGAYVGALRNVYGIYKEMKKVFASADDYMIKVYKDIEEIRMALFKRNAIDPANEKALLKALAKINKKPLKALKNDRKVLGIKIGQLHRKAGEASKEVEKAKKNLEAAIGVNPPLARKHRTTVKTLTDDLATQVSQHKWFKEFDKKAADYEFRIEARMKDETMKAKAFKAGKITLEELGVYFLSTSSDMTAATLASKGGMKLTSILTGWGDRINTGLNLLSAIGIG